MKNLVRTLDYYGYEDDSTMYKRQEEKKNECFNISKIVEIRNSKYVKEDD